MDIHVRSGGPFYVMEKIIGTSSRITHCYNSSFIVTFSRLSFFSSTRIVQFKTSQQTGVSLWVSLLGDHWQNAINLLCIRQEISFFRRTFHVFNLLLDFSYSQIRAQANQKTTGGKHLQFKAAFPICYGFY